MNDQLFTKCSKPNKQLLFYFIICSYVLPALKKKTPKIKTLKYKFNGADIAQMPAHRTPKVHTEESPWAITNDPASLTILGSEK